MRVTAEKRGLKLMKKGRRGFKTIDEYVSTFPDDVQILLQKMRQTIRQAAPEAEEAISYRIPTFKLNGNLVHFAAFKSHIGFFPTSSGIAAFKKELSHYKSSTGSVQFPMDRPIPYGLVRRIVAFRRKESLKKHGLKLKMAVARRSSPKRRRAED